MDTFPNFASLLDGSQSSSKSPNEPSFSISYCRDAHLNSCWVLLATLFKAVQK